MNAEAVNPIEAWQRHCAALATRRVEDDPVVKKLQLAKQTTWLFLLTLAFLIYFLIDIMQEALILLG